MRFLILGDVHGDKKWMFHQFYENRDRGIDAVIQLGDLGVGFPLQQGEKPLLHHIEKQCSKYGWPFYFVDGNHDCQPLIWKSGHITDDGLRQISDHVFYIPRGHVFELEGTTFLGLGGAFSIDRDWRLEHRVKTGESIWWVTETIRAQDTYNALENARDRKIDVMLTHEAPWHVFERVGRTGEALDYKSDQLSREQQRQIYDVTKQVRPTLLLHGHWHHRYNMMLDFYDDNPVKVVGLGMNRGQGASLVLDLPEDLHGEWM